MGILKVEILLIFLLLSSYVPIASADEVHTTSYSDTIDSQSTWSEVKLLPNAFDSNNATATFIEANRCDGGSATCTSGQTFIVLDIEIQMSSNTTRADVRWKMETPDGSTPVDSKGAISIFDSTNSNWALQVEDTVVSTTVRVQEIPVTNNNLDASNMITLRFALYHNGTSFASDELAMYVYTVYDVREDVTDTDGDGIDDADDDCPNGETGWTSTPLTDHDGDGCRDSSEDNDNDNDLVVNINDDCPEGELSWLSSPSTDYDGDGCKDNHLEDDDDDNDGYNDTEEITCASDPLDESSLPTLDLDGDGTCDAADLDMDGDGLSNDVETNTSVYIDELDTGTSSMNADSDGDSYCDGPSIPVLPTDVCTNPSDAFPNDAAAYRDTDGDGMPDELIGTSSTGLIEDLDDDDDDWTDTDEAACGNTDPKDDASFPVDGDGDGICDLLDSLTLNYEQNGVVYSSFEAYVGQANFEILPNLTGMEATSWEYSGILPNDFQFDEGAITGIVVNDIDQFELIIWVNNSVTGISLNTTISIVYIENYDEDSLPDGPSMNGLLVDDDDDNDGVFDEDDACPRGEIGLTSDNDTDGDGCRDFLEINLFQITERNDLWFTENASSPLPESCLLEGLNNSILKCSTLQDDQLGRSNDGGNSPDISTNILAIEELRADYIDGQWYNVYPLKSGEERLIPRSNPIPLFDTEFIFTVDQGIESQCICGDTILDVEVRFSAPGIANINGINLNGETGNISGTPTDVQSQLVVSVFLELKQSSEGYGRQGSTVIFVVHDKPPKFAEQNSLDYTNLVSYDLENFNRGGEVTDWDMPQQWPTGLSLNSDGELVGTTSEQIEDKSFVVYFNNSNPNGGGSFELILTNNPGVDEESNTNIFVWAGAILFVVLLASLLGVLSFRRKQDGNSSKQTLPPDNHPPPVAQPPQIINIEVTGKGTAVVGDIQTIVNAVVNQTQTVNTSPRPGNPIDEFALWCMERLKMNGPKKIGDQTMLIPPEDVIKNIGESTTIDLKISIALNYPENWKEAGAAPARAEIDKFLRELAYIAGKFDVGTGFFVHGGEGATKDIQVEYSGTFSSVQSPTSLASLLGLIRSAIWEYCDVLIQRSVFVQIGPHISDCVNPCPLEMVKNIERWLDDGMEHIDLPRESFEQTIKPERASMDADLSF